MIEAGLGGRYDATNVIASRSQVLTNVGLEHTRWLGPTIARHRGREARGRAGRAATLVLGRGPAPDADAVAEAVAEAARARGSYAPGLIRAVGVGARGAFQRVNFAVAIAAAAQAYLRRARSATRSPRGRRRGARARAPPVLGEHPLTLLDGAHNPDGDRRRWSESLPRDPRRRGALVARRRRVDPRRQGRCGDARGAAASVRRARRSPALRTRAPCRLRRSSRSPALSSRLARRANQRGWRPGAREREPRWSAPIPARAGARARARGERPDGASSSRPARST